MTLQQLIYFRAAARHSYITRAARELYVSQPSLSVSLKNLEEELGMPLFERNGQGIRLTQAGRRFLAHAERILGDVEQARLEMEQLRRSAGDSFTIGYISPLGNDAIADVVEGLATSPELAGLSLHSLEVTTAQAEAALMADEIDAALCSHIPGNPELTQLPVMEQPLVLIVAREHPLARRPAGQAVTARELAAWPLVTYRAESSMMDSIRRYFHAHPPMPAICHRAGNEEAIASLVERGMGAAIVAQTGSVTPERLAVLPLEGLDERRTIYLSWRTHRTRAPLIGKALNRLRDSLQK